MCIRDRDIYDKKRDCLYQEVLLLEDGSDDGDGYDYSPIKDDYIIRSHHVKANIEIQQKGMKKVAQISYDMSLPKDLNSRKERCV